VFFFHGDHPLSLIHEDGTVHSGARHVLKCTVLYKLHADAEGTEEYKQCVEQHPNIYHGRQKWEQGGYGLFLSGGLGGLSDAVKQILAMMQPRPPPPPPAPLVTAPGAVAPVVLEQPPSPCSVGPGRPPPELEADAGSGPVVFADGIPPDQEFAVGELVEAIWEPEGRFYRARVEEIKSGSRLLVKWTDWEGDITVPLSRVRQCSAVVPERRSIPTDWETLD